MSEWKPWIIEKLVKKGDYLYAIVRNHPSRTKNDYVLYHRVIVENDIKRLLTHNEVVHHKNKDKKDNRKENLELTTQSEHSKHHGAEKGHKMATVKCPCCSKIFEMYYNQTHLCKKRGRYTCCSRSCSGKFSRQIQLKQNLVDSEQRIADNIQKLYNNLAP